MRGQVLTIRAKHGENIRSSFYFSLALGKPVITGGAEYDWNIANCNKTIYHWGDPLTPEPGAMSGPTVSGAELLIAKDPGAYWDTSTNKVKGSAYGARARASSRSRSSTRSSTTAASGTAATPTWSPPTGLASSWTTSRATASSAASSRSPGFATRARARRRLACRRRRSGWSSKRGRSTPPRAGRVKARPARCVLGRRADPRRDVSRPNPTRTANPRPTFSSVFGRRIRHRANGDAPHRHRPHGCKPL